jgi:signal peptidase I
MTMSTPPRPQLRAGDVVVLRGSEEYVEGDVIAVLAEGRYKVKWTTGLDYRDRVTSVTADEVRKKPSRGIS